MKKKILAFLAATSLMTSVAMAAPMTDYSQGKTAIDLTMRNTEGKAIGNTYKEKYNLDWGVTTGLGNDWAIQYRQFNPKSKSTSYSDVDDFGNPFTGSAKAQLKTSEINVLRKVTDNVSIYAGVMRTKAEFEDTLDSPFSSNSKNKWQLGLVGSTQIADKLTGYASVGAGKDLTSWQIGVAYEVAPNVDFNVDYRQIKVDNLKFVGEDFDVKAKGLGFGVTYKF